MRIGFGTSARGRLAWAIPLLICLLDAPASEAQGESRWSLDEYIQGSFSSAGELFRIDTRVGYQLNGHLEVGGGLPLYIVRASDGLDPLGGGWNAGLGNAYLDARLSTGGPEWFLASGITASAPTGDRDRGFGTGEVTVDWTNSLAFYLPGATLFGSAGLANSVSDTSFFVRPFTTTGLVTHFDAGLFVPFNSWLGAGALGYGIAGGGEQTLRSRVIQTDRPAAPGRPRGFETTVETRGEDLADDHGYSAWLDFAAEETHFQVGFTRSLPYAYNTAFFSVGFDVISWFR